MGGKDEEAGVGGYGSVRFAFFVLLRAYLIARMSVGLGMTPDEWQELRSQVDDSFWVMRIIGMPLSTCGIILSHI